MDTIISAILGSLIGSFSAASLSYIYHERKEKQKLKINCRLLLDVVVKHSTWLDKNRLADEASIIKFAHYVNLEPWDDLKYDLSGLKFQQFEIVREHFKQMRDFRNTIENFNPQKAIYPFPDDLFVPYKETCNKALTALADVCYPDRKYT